MSLARQAWQAESLKLNSSFGRIRFYQEIWNLETERKAEYLKQPLHSKDYDTSKLI